MCENKNCKKWKISTYVLSVVLTFVIVFSANPRVLSDIGYILKTSVTSLGIFDKTNEKREDNQVETLIFNEQLSRSAQAKADDMAAKGYFAHTSPEGYSFTHWFKEAGYQYLFVGENLAVKFHDDDAVIGAWMNSTTHRANILNDRFQDMGIGIATGMYDGKEVTFVVQHFGQPLPDFSAILELLNLNT